jgi:hypothetical protein
MPNDHISIYKRSYIDALYTDVAITSDEFTEASLANLNDGDLDTYATTEGETGTADTATIIIDLGTARAIDTLILSSNIKRFSLHVTDNLGSGWAWYQAGSPGEYKTNTAEARMWEVNLDDTLTYRYWKLRFDQVITAEEEYKLYELYMVDKVCDLDVNELTGLSLKYSRRTAQNCKGGSIQIVHFPTEPKLQFGVKLKNLTTAFGDYLAAKEAFLLDSCLVRPYFSDDITPLSAGKIYMMNDVSDIGFPISNKYIVTGVDGSFDLREE